MRHLPGALTAFLFAAAAGATSVSAVDRSGAPAPEAPNLTLYLGVASVGMVLCLAFAGWLALRKR